MNDMTDYEEQQANAMESQSDDDTTSDEEKLALSDLEIRVLGCLIEKETTTPEYYPLTLNSLTAACNQKSNRDPVMALDQKSVVRTLDDLRYKHQLVAQVSTAGSRVPKYRHCLPNKWGFTQEQKAIICCLFLRGSQTVGELRTRAGRLYKFASTGDVELTLESLVNYTNGALVVQLARQPGRKERRWAHLFSGDVEIEESTIVAPAEPVRREIQAEDNRIATLETDVAALRETIEAMKQEFEVFKKQFE